MLNIIPLHIALKEYDILEIPGANDNARIVQYFADIGHSWVKDDETAWCAAFANWVLKQCNITGTGKLNARSFLNVGQVVTTPEVGDIVIFWRVSPTGWEGHVGFYITERNGLIYTLGGNQSNKVCIAGYSKNQLLGYRRVTTSVNIETPKDIKKATLKELVNELNTRV